MITRDNLKEVIFQLDEKDKKRILNNENKEYCVLYLHCFNSGSYTELKLTNNYNRYKNVSNNGNCILYSKEIKDILKG